MNKLLIGGAGGVPSENVIKSLIKSNNNQEIIGIGSEPLDLILSLANKKYKVPYAEQKNYKESLLKILNCEKPDLAHFQNDLEIREVSRIRETILETGTKLYMPSKETVEICVDKAKSALIWMKEGIKVPKTIIINNEEDLKLAFSELSNNEGKIWIRASVGGGGRGALPTDNFDFAKMWIDKFSGWGDFTAAELLTPRTVTWLSIWYEGELVVAQSRLRHSWNMGNRTLSGVTGVTQVGETISDEVVDKTAQAAILAIDKKPHGIFGVDMTYDSAGIPNPTEINISRFFTTVYFFTSAGLNLPQIMVDIALENKFPSLEKRINPLTPGLMWIRSMDREPMLITKESLSSIINLGDSM